MSRWPAPAHDPARACSMSWRPRTRWSREGTYPLPEAQLDRFLLQIDVGYPDLEAERRIAAGHHHGRLKKRRGPGLRVRKIFRKPQNLVRRISGGRAG